MNNEERFDSAASLISPKFSHVLLSLDRQTKKFISEIRLRVNRPATVTYKGKEKFFSKNGLLDISKDNYQLAVVANVGDIEESFRKICGYSVHSHQSEIVCGFVTADSGHRCGICGTAVEDEGKIIGMRDISSINVRIAREIKGSADKLISLLEDSDCGFIVAGAPSSGKTTVLRDICRQFGDREKIVVVDERGEIASSKDGVPQNDVGTMTDVLSSYPKAEGIMQALRTMSPKVIICDEIGTSKEIEAVAQGLNGGVNIITSIHAEDMKQLLSRPQAVQLLKTGAFSKIFFLGSGENLGEITSVERVEKIND